MASRSSSPSQPMLSPVGTNNRTSTYFSTQNLPDEYNVDPFHDPIPERPTDLEAQPLPHHCLLDIPANFELDDFQHRPSSEDELDDGVLIEQFRDLLRWQAVLNLCTLLFMTVAVVGLFVGVPMVSYLQRAAAQAG